MDELAAMPAGSHIGQLEISFIDGFLPRQFLMHYTYEFLYRMKCSLYSMRTRAQSGLPLRAHSVAEELLVTFCEQEASALIELSGKFYEIGDETSGDWIFDLFGDSDLLQFLYSGMYLEPDHPYHLSHWYEPQFLYGISLCRGFLYERSRKPAVSLGFPALFFLFEFAESSLF